MKKRLCNSLFLAVFLSLGWLAVIPSAQALQAPDTKTDSSALSGVQKERDHILSLLTLAFVHNDWQQGNTNPARGHNIGSILVDPNGIPVFWTRNSVKALGNSNQHGEVRLATRYLSSILTNKYMPKGYVVYTSLEPCAMCTGMLSMVETERVVFVQEDPEFGNVAKALTDINYPRVYTVATPTEMKQKQELDSGWSKYRKEHKNPSITDYLLTSDAEKIYASAKTDLTTYAVTYAENKPVLQAAVLLSKSNLPELIGAAGKAQKLWQTGVISYSKKGTWNVSPTLFISYVDWAGVKNIAQVVDDSFYVCAPSAPCKKVEQLEYINNKTAWKASLTNGVFTHTRKDGNNTHQDGIIVYEDWKGEETLGLVQNIALPD
ncbi:nucleoside deaminase [Desulfovibrio cuneatus]|uniref:nucleoside deaminase n=1 Tax=Desulfovibrio cuneatus TaxID=159728 RepID=UPI0003FE8172|nr:nucleoside deaminase [Desulfovibrio cuneatus]